jgi:polyhydroxyalkanoate synthesis regulator phasin
MSHDREEWNTKAQQHELDDLYQSVLRLEERVTQLEEEIKSIKMFGVPRS